jgi:hypothetical protein
VATPVAAAPVIIAMATPVPVMTTSIPANTIVPSQPQAQPQAQPQPVQRPLAPLNPIPEQKPSHGIDILDQRTFQTGTKSKSRWGNITPKITNSPL